MPETNRLERTGNSPRSNNRSRAFRLQTYVAARVRQIGVVLTVFTLISGGLVLWDMHARSIAIAKGNITNIGELLSEQTFHYIQIIDVLLQQVESHSTGLRIETPSQFRAQFGNEDTHRFLAGLLENLPGNHLLGVFDSEGDFINGGSLPTAAPFNIADRDYFQALKSQIVDKMVIGTIENSRINHGRDVYLARRISARNGTFLGVSLTLINVSYLDGIYSALGQKAGLSITLLRSDGLVLARFSNFGQTIRTIPAASRWYNTVKDGGGIYESIGLTSGVPNIIAVTPMRKYPLVLDVSINKSAVLATLSPAAIVVGTTMLILAGMIMTLFSVISRRLRLQDEYNAALLQSADALRESEAHLDRAQEFSRIGSWELNLETGEYTWSKQMYRMINLPFDRTPNRQTVANNVLPGEYPALADWENDLAAGNARGPIEIRIARPDGTERLLRREGRPIIDPDGVIRRIAGTTQDVTEQRLIERRLAHAAKMEVVGQLTSGIAHDFNNLLAVILGNTQLLERNKGSPGPQDAALVSEVRDAAERAAALTRRLLAFSRQQSLEPVVTDLNQVVSGMTTILRRTLGSQITIDIIPTNDPYPVSVDVNQLENAILNLAINARDAMPSGGTLTISIRNLTADPTCGIGPRDAGSQHYGVISVRDTGTGMTKDVMQLVFEPFFTTKPTGQGTGLGLSQVRGLVEQSGGYVKLSSEVGHGTEVILCLPRYRPANDIDVKGHNCSA